MFKHFCPSLCPFLKQNFNIAFSSNLFWPFLFVLAKFRWKWILTMCKKKEKMCLFHQKIISPLNHFFRLSPLNSYLNQSCHISVTKLIKHLIWQVEKRNGNTPFTQYYKNIMSKAASRNSISDRKVWFTQSLVSSKFLFVWPPACYWVLIWDTSSFIAVWGICHSC